jgi:two-component system OmpR family sensor kinase
LSRIPIRLRLTLPFALGMALILAAMGVVIYVRVGGELLSSVDQNLGAQATEATSHAREGRTLLDQDVSEGPAIAQVELPDGTIVDSAPSTLPALLDSNALGNALSGHRVRATMAIRGLSGEWRLLEVPVQIDDQNAVLIVGRSLAARAETLHRLASEFLFAAPAVLLLAILGGYGLAVAALRPVEAMRRRAQVVSATTPGRRLPVPPARDEIAALAVTLNEMLGRLEAAFAHERRFVADASHELRTPLALLRGELELALRRPRSRKELEKAVRSAAEETERLTRLAEDLLLIARSDQGALPLRCEKVEVGELLERVRARFVGRAEALGCELSVERAGEMLLDADPVRVEQALGNLVDNALLHGTGFVSLASRSRDGSVELHVTDDGDGFPESFVERAFDRFSRADDVRSSPGTGLGLAIVALIARAHGGEAHAQNGERGGADVWIALPGRSSVAGQEGVFAEQRS